MEGEKVYKFEGLKPYIEKVTISIKELELAVALSKVLSQNKMFRLGNVPTREDIDALILEAADAIRERKQFEA